MTPPAGPDATRSQRLLLVAAGVVVAVAVALRFVTRSDLWLDEALSVNIARLPLGDIPRWLEHDGAPPLYYVLLHGWTGLFGSGDLAARSLSGLCSVATLPVAWSVARRIGGVRYGITATLLFAVNPFAIRYATEARMYSLVILLVTLGMLVLRRAWEDPSPVRLLALGAVATLLLYTQYWALYLLIVVGGLLVLGALLRADLRSRVFRLILALGAAAVAFVPWIPTFLYQRAHTGTPWGTAVLPGLPTGQSLLEFSGSGTQEGWLLYFPIAALVMLGALGRTRADGRIEIGSGGRPNVVPEAVVGIGTLFFGASLSYLGDSAFQPRYAAVVLPFFVLVLAAGVDRFSDRRVHGAILAVLCLAGVLGGWRSFKTNRTQAGQVAAILAAEADAGDVVFYCPDQLGPAVSRLAPPGLVPLSDPPSPQPGELVDWVDYTDAIAARSADEVAAEVLRRAGNRTVWMVSAPGYITHTGRCEDIATKLGADRTGTVRVVSDEEIFERPGLVEFAPR